MTDNYLLPLSHSTSLLRCLLLTTERCAKYRAATVQGKVIPTQPYSTLPIDILQVFFSLGAIVLWRPHASQPHSDESQVGDSHYTFSKNVSGFFGSKISLQVMTVTRSSVSERLMMLWVHPGIIYTASILSPLTSNSTVSPVLIFLSWIKPWSAFFIRGTQNYQRDTRFSFFAGRDTGKDKK